MMISLSERQDALEEVRMIHILFRTKYWYVIRNPKLP